MKYTKPRARSSKRSVRSFEPQEQIAKDRVVALASMGMELFGRGNLLDSPTSFEDVRAMYSLTFESGDPPAFAIPTRHLITLVAQKSADHTLVVDEYEETDYSCLQDLRGWLNGERTISPSQVKRFCQIVDMPWLYGLRLAGFYQHIVVLIDELLHCRQFHDVVRLSTFLFPIVPRPGKQSSLHRAVADIGESEYADLRRIETFAENEIRLRRVFGPIKVSEIRREELRAVVRLCDPAEYELLSDREEYPTEAAQRFCAKILADLIPAPHKYDPLSAGSIRRSLSLS